MPKAGTGNQEQMTTKERAIVESYIEHCNSRESATERTQAKKRHYAYKIIAVLHELGTTLDKATYEDLTKVPGKLKNKGGKNLTQNSRQSFVSQLKAMTAYMEKTRKISGEKTLFSDIKAGSPSKQNKEVLSAEEWSTVLNAPMSAKERAYLAMLYDGYHRPGEPLTLKWSDMKVNSGGAVEYKITFKTDIPRIIVQKPDTTALLEAWKRECGHNYGDDAYIFPERSGKMYSTIAFAVDLFARLSQVTGLKNLVPSSIRNTSISHDVQNEMPLQYICLRAWGEPFNDMINVYTKANSSKMQSEQHAKNGNGQAVRVETVKPKDLKNLRECPSCHKKNTMGGEFCLYCGANMEGKATSEVDRLRLENLTIKAQLAAMDRQQARMAKVLEKLLPSDDGRTLDEPLADEE